jgi:hypothetical protein
MPNFLIIGAEKCGTTALYHYLRQHPQVYMSPAKETGFFGAEGRKPDTRAPGHLPTKHINNIDDYRALFEEVSNEAAIGEASPYYLYSTRALERIHHYIPAAKLITILRDPAERAYSNYLHAIWLGREPLTDFSQALFQEEERIKASWESLFHYKQKGFYYAQLRRYFDRFNQGQIRVYLKEDLDVDSASVMKDIFRFLCVDEEFVPDVSLRPNVSGIPKNRMLHKLVMELNRPSIKRLFPDRLVRGLREPIRNSILAKPPKLPLEARKALIGVYREDILRLQELIQRDLSTWLE